jgi:hypothetical protein
MKKILMAIVLCLVCAMSFGQFSYQQKETTVEEKQKVWSYNSERLEYFPEREMYCYSMYAPIKHYNEDYNRIENYDYNPISGKFEWKYKTQRIELWFETKEDVIEFVTKGKDLTDSENTENITYENNGRIFYLRVIFGGLSFMTYYDEEHYMDGAFNLCYFAKTVVKRLSNFP